MTEDRFKYRSMHSVISIGRVWIMERRKEEAKRGLGRVYSIEIDSQLQSYYMGIFTNLSLISHLEESSSMKIMPSLILRRA